MTRPASLAPRAKTRRSQEERRRQTQGSVLDASIDVLLDRGFTGLTTTEVAARAGVSRGALAHYFRTREDLIVAATRHLMDRGTALSTEAAERARGAADPIAHFIADAERFFFDRIYVGMIELLVAARTDPVLAREFLPIVSEWRTQVNDTWFDLFDEAGIPKDRARLILHMTNNLMRGLALTSLWDDTRALRKELLENWRATVKDIAEAAGAKAP